MISAVQNDSGWGTTPLNEVYASTSFGIKYILFDHNKNSSSNKLQKNINKRKKKKKESKSNFEPTPHFLNPKEENLK